MGAQRSTSPYAPLVTSAMWQRAKQINRALDEGRRLKKDEIPTLTPRQALFWGLMALAVPAALVLSLDELGVPGPVLHVLSGLSGVGTLYGLTWIDRRSARRGRLAAAELSRPSR